jgi:hypothetical protein
MRIFPLSAGQIAVEDRFNGRMHILNADGTSAGLMPIPSLSTLPNPAVRDRFADGSWLAVAPIRERAGATNETASIALNYHRVSSDWRTSASVLHALTRPRWSVTIEGRPRPFPLPFTVDDVVAVAGTDVIVSRAGAPEIRRHDNAGALRSIHRWNPPRRESSVFRERYVRETLDATEPARRPAVARFLASELPLPRHLPSVQRLEVDELGIIWAERYRLPWEDEPEWDLLSPTGEWLGTVRLPRRFHALHIGRDGLLGVQRDDLDVERVVVLPLHR